MPASRGALERVIVDGFAAKRRAGVFDALDERQCRQDAVDYALRFRHVQKLVVMGQRPLVARLTLPRAGWSKLDLNLRFRIGGSRGSLSLSFLGLVPRAGGPRASFQHSYCRPYEERQC